MIGPPPNEPFQNWTRHFWMLKNKRERSTVPSVISKTLPHSFNCWCQKLSTSCICTSSKQLQSMLFYYKRFVGTSLLKALLNAGQNWLGLSTSENTPSYPSSLNPLLPPGFRVFLLLFQEINWPNKSRPLWPLVLRRRAPPSNPCWPAPAYRGREDCAQQVARLGRRQRLCTSLFSTEPFANGIPT